MVSLGNTPHPHRPQAHPYTGRNLRGALASASRDTWRSRGKGRGKVWARNEGFRGGRRGGDKSNVEDKGERFSDSTKWKGRGRGNQEKVSVLVFVLLTSCGCRCVSVLVISSLLPCL